MSEEEEQRANEQLQKTAEAIKTIQNELRNGPPSVKKKVGDLLAGADPASLGAFYNRDRHRHKHPYYNEESAMLLKPIIDAQMQHKKDVVFCLDDFRPLWNLSTLRAKIFNGKQWILDYMDDENQTYLKYFCSLKIKTTNESITLHILKDQAKSLILDGKMPHRIVEPELSGGLDTLNPPWRTVVEEFLAKSDPTGFLKLKELSLTEEQILLVKMLLHGNPIYQYKISSTEIMIIPNETNT
jgi:hypothetical protein